MRAIRAVQSLLSYTVLALSQAVTNLPHKLYFSLTLKDGLLNSMTFQAWKMKCLNSMTFQVFHDLYEPYYFVRCRVNISISSSIN